MNEGDGRADTPRALLARPLSVRCQHRLLQDAFKDAFTGGDEIDRDRRRLARQDRPKVF